jgi:hypothetical protein
VTDTLGPIQRADLSAFMDDLRDQVPKYGRLDLYAVSSIGNHPLQALFRSCNPGSGRDVASPLVGNPVMADRAWKQKFADKLDEALNQIVNSKDADNSPIMEDVQSVSVTSFEGDGEGADEKKLILVSDLLQFTKRVSFYVGAPDFSAFKSTDYYKEIRTELRGVRVTISIIPRETRRNAQNKKLYDFWTTYFADQGAIVESWRPLKGGEH